MDTAMQPRLLWQWHVREPAVAYVTGPAIINYVSADYTKLYFH